MLRQCPALFGANGGVVVSERLEHLRRGFPPPVLGCTGLVGRDGFAERLLVLDGIAAACAGVPTAGGSGAQRAVFRQLGVKVRALCVHVDRHLDGAVTSITADLLLDVFPGFRCIALVDSFLLRVGESQGFLPVGIVFIQERRFSQTGLCSNSERRAYLGRVGLGILGVQVQDTVDILRRALKVAVLHEQAGALHQADGSRSSEGGRGALDRLLYHPGRLRLFLGIENLPHTADQVLHKADLAHVLALQAAQLVRQVIGIHIPVAGDQQPLAVVRHQNQIAAPLVLHPHRIEILRLRANDHHHPGRLQGSEDVGLVFLPQFVLQCDAAEEHLVTLLCQAIVNLLRPLAVMGALAARVGLLVADEHVVWLFVLRDSEDAFLDLRDPGGLFLIQAAAFGVRRVLHRGPVVLIRQDGGQLQTVAGWNAPAGSRVLDILDAVAADRGAPVCLGVGVILLQDLFIGRQCLVELALPAEVVGPVVAVQLSLIIRLRDRGRAAAVFAGAVGRAGDKLDVAPAHLAFDDHG